MAQSSRRSNDFVARRALVSNPDPIANNIAVLAGKGVEALRTEWFRRLGYAAPPIQSADVLRRLLAWKIQTEAFGDFDSETLAALKRARTAIAKGKTPVSQSSTSSLRAGTILVREWRGVMHRVLVLDVGFEHEGKRFGSLSEVARAISGTRWSGPRFFGLEERPSRAPGKSPFDEAADDPA